MQEPTLSRLKQKLQEEEAIYGDLLSELDEASSIPAPLESDPGLTERLDSLNRSPALISQPDITSGSGIKFWLRRVVRRFVEPELALIHRELAEQKSLNSELVQFINRYTELSHLSFSRTARLSSVLVGFAQRIDRLADAKDRLYVSLSNDRNDLMLEAMDKRLTSAASTVDSMRLAIDGLQTHVSLARSELKRLAAPAGLEPTPEVGSPPRTARATVDGPFRDEHYTAFQDRFRGSEEAIRDHLLDYVEVLRDHHPVVELGCGRGEFLALLEQADVEASGIDTNREMVRACTNRGLDASEANLIDFLEQRQSESAGSLFSAQVVEHLPPNQLRAVLENCFRVLRPGGLLVLETVNPRSILALVESFYRDLTHEKPLHPETIDFMLRAAGFEQVETRYRSPVPHRARLLPVVSDDHENPEIADALGAVNQNFEKLNAFLFADMDYAAIATKASTIV